jgi:SAM-dependent methyltransferase
MKGAVKAIVQWDQRSEAQKAALRKLYRQFRSVFSVGTIRARRFHPIDWQGFCPICNHTVTFRAEAAWLRDNLFCLSCERGSIPRERALMLTIESLAPQWRTLRIHESSPSERGVSLRLRRECPAYIATQFFPNITLGAQHAGVRCEDLEHQTFADESFDLVITQDVMEHVFEPALVYREIWRTLRPRGLYLHTTPIYKQRVSSMRRAAKLADGSIRYLARREYHGNPIDDQGSLVTWHYGYDLPDLIVNWAPFDVEVRRFHDRRHGVLGEFTEVIACRKNPHVPMPQV